MTSSLPPDPWKVLGVDRNADKAEIRTAYKKLVLKCHPDKIQDPTLKTLKADEFQKVQQAWELLNDDAEKAKYEQKLRLAELQRAAKVHQDVKNSPNTSVPRTAKYTTFEVRTAEPTSKYKSSPSGGKVYTYTTATHARSYEEVPSTRIYAEYEEPDRKARRAASYEKPAKRDDERRERDREERRRRKEEEEFTRQREEKREREREKDRERREREKERERERKVEKKRLERDREREREKARKRDADEKARYTKQPYVEHYESYISGLEDLVLEDEMYVMSGSKSDKKRSSSKKHDETRERDRERDREKSSSRRAKSPHVASDRKHADLLEFAAEYLARTGSSGASQKAMGASQQAMAWMSEDPPSATFVAPTVPTPPPVEFVEEESIRLSAPRTTGRRASNDAARSREKLKYDLDDTPSKGRPIPTLSKSYSTPPPVPESPPRISRSKTVPHESYTAMPSLSRTQTWAPGATSTADYYDDVESEDDRDRRRRRSRRTRSPSGQGAQRYKVDGSLKTSKIETQYSYGESPSSTRRYMTSEVYDSHLGHSPSSVSYSSTGLRYKQAKAIGPEDVMYAQYDPPVSYSYSSHTAEGYGVQA
ncbi:DnaJ-domain-containing protein [Thermothelomyces heterothallicus CBS 203.75]